MNLLRRPGLVVACTAAPGAEVSQVRTVPVPDGRVLLVTGDGVRFFAV